MIYALMIAVALAAFAGNGWLNAQEKIGQLNTAFQAQKIEVQKAKEVNDKLVKDFQAKTLALHKMQLDRRADNAKFNFELSALRSKIESTQSAAEKYPDRYGRLATNIINRELRRACVASGGKPGYDCRSTRIKNPKAGHPDKPKTKRNENTRAAKAGSTP